MNRTRKTPWKLSVTRKANARARLKKVDAVIDTVRASGVQCKALVSMVSPPLAPVNLTPHRTAPCCCPKNTKCPPKTNTLSLVQPPEDIERVYTKCPNGQGYASHSRWQMFLQLPPKADAKSQPKRILVDIYVTFVYTYDTVGHARLFLPTADNH